MNAQNRSMVGFFIVVFSIFISACSSPVGPTDSITAAEIIVTIPMDSVPEIIEAVEIELGVVTSVPEDIPTIPPQQPGVEKPWAFRPVFATKHEKDTFDFVPKEGWSILTVFLEVENTTDEPRRFDEYLYYHYPDTALNNVSPEQVRIATADGFMYPLERGNIGLNLASNGVWIPPNYRAGIYYDELRPLKHTHNYMIFRVPTISDGYEIVFPGGERVSLAETPFDNEMEPIQRYTQAEDVHGTYRKYQQPNTFSGGLGNMRDFHQVSQNGWLKVDGSTGEASTAVSIAVSLQNNSVGQDSVFDIPLLFTAGGVIYRPSDMPLEQIGVGPGLTKEENLNYKLLGSDASQALLGSGQFPVWIDLE